MSDDCPRLSIYLPAFALNFGICLDMKLLNLLVWRLALDASFASSIALASIFRRLDYFLDQLLSCIVQALGHCIFPIPRHLRPPLTLDLFHQPPIKSIASR